MTDLALKILKRIAEQKFNDNSNGEVKKGHYKHVKNPDNLREEMATYYDLYSSSSSSSNKISMTVPYYDAFGLGVITSLCKPVRAPTLKGVTCIDISITDLLEDVEFFRAGLASYAFLVDDKNRVLIHPLIPRPVDVTDDPAYVPLKELEQSMTYSQINEIIT